MTNKVEKSYLNVSGLCCSSEASLIERILKPLPGVTEVTVVVPSRTVIVHHQSILISQIQIVDALNESGLNASVKDKAGEGENSNKNNKKKWPSPFVLGSGFLVLLTLILQHVYRPLHYLGLAAVALAIFPIFMKAVAAIRHFNLSNINILVLITVAGSIVLKDYFEAGAIVFLFTFSQWLEFKANIVPQTAFIAETGERVNADQVQLNTILSIKPGDVIPIDGVVVQGNCDVDEKTLTGESFPVSKQIGSTVWAGTINLNGHLNVNTTALPEDCVVTRMANLVEEAQKNKSKTQRIVDKFTKYYTPFIIAIALCLVIVPSAIGAHNLSEWCRLALVVLVSACPCALVLSTPVAAFCALSNAAKSGLLVKGAEHLETLAKVKIMAFDKTGTITTGEFIVADFKPILQDDHITLDKLLYWVSSIESKSSHPMAEALVKYAKSYSVDPKPDEVEEFHNFPGEGIYGKIDGKDIYIGNKRIALRAGCLTLPTIGDDEMEGKSIGYIFSGSFPAGIFSLSDVCRTGVKEAIQELKSMGIKTAMLTGDHQAAAKHAQDQIDGALELVHSELLPEDKARIIKDFQHESTTAMIGDGLNDAAALATADIGISMGISGSALAMETGNIILMSNDIRKIPLAVRLARKTKLKILENLFLSVITKTAIVVLAIMGHPLVWAAVLADAGTCLLVICNSMLLLAHKDNHSKGNFKSSISRHGNRIALSHKHCCSVIKRLKKHMHTRHFPKKCSAQSLSNGICSLSCGFQMKTTLAKDQGCCEFDDQKSQGVQHNVAIFESEPHCRQRCCSANQVETKCIPHFNSPKYQCESMNSKSFGEIGLLPKDHSGCEHDVPVHGVQQNVVISESNSHCHQRCCSANQDETRCIPGFNSPKNQYESASTKSFGKMEPLPKDQGCCELDDNPAHEVQQNVAMSESESKCHQHCCPANQVERKCIPHFNSPKHQSESASPKSFGEIEPFPKDQGYCELDDNQAREVQQNVAIYESKSKCQQHCCSANQVDIKCIPDSNPPKHQCKSGSPKSFGAMEPLSNSAATDGCCDNGDDKLDSNVDFQSSEVRQVRGCCKKECCGKAPLFELALGGILSEIVIE
ncbi:hypothetical protein DCAR_0417484 [Daucus carota subsp. sativus]|uniref:HMA domain-containing protein n=1 Tax=Daucus carota subsp. sativus TaxID=79200 RepID=A0AAF1AWM9_DAUCS|nr:hypothetical protein DCAR_0417484 [Daucus carota subsp. sativus]